MGLIFSSKFPIKVKNELWCELTSETPITHKKFPVHMIKKTAPKPVKIELKAAREISRQRLRYSFGVFTYDL